MTVPERRMEYVMCKIGAGLSRQECQPGELKITQMADCSLMNMASSILGTLCIPMTHCMSW